MDLSPPHGIAPDPVTEPEKCSGVRMGFAIISAVGVLVFAVAALALYSPRLYQFLNSTSDYVAGGSRPVFGYCLTGCAATEDQAEPAEKAPR